MSKNATSYRWAAAWTAADAFVERIGDRLRPRALEQLHGLPEPDEARGDGPVLRLDARCDRAPIAAEKHCSIGRPAVSGRDATPSAAAAGARASSRPAPLASPSTAGSTLAAVPRLTTISPASATSSIATVSAAPGR